MGSQRGSGPHPVLTHARSCHGDPGDHDLCDALHRRPLRARAASSAPPQCLRPQTCPIHPVQPHSTHPGASQLVVVLVRYRDPVDDLPEGTGSGVALGLCHPWPMLPPSGHGLAVTGTPRPQGAPPRIPHNTRTPRTHSHLQKGFGSETSPSRAPDGHPHPKTSLLL